MPQLDVSTFSSQFFWFLVCFLVLFYVVSFLFLPNLDKTLATRNQRILGSFENAMHLLKFAKNKADQYNVALQQTKIQAKEIMDNALFKVKEMEIGFQSKLKAKIEESDRLVTEEVNKFKIESMGELRKIAIGIALIYYTELTNSTIEERQVSNLLEI